jgi:hypothetical protein
MLKMRILMFFVLLILGLTACVGGGEKLGAGIGDNNKVEVAKAVAQVVNQDSISMAETIHTFYKWYGESGKQLITKIIFVNKSAKHPTLDLKILGNYLGEFSKSGAICMEFIQNETIFYRACALAWREENSDGLLTGFEADRYYCEQDGDVSEFLTAGITYQITDDRATVQLLLDPNGPNGGPRNFEMKKENGKWLLSKNGCESAFVH